MAVTAKAESSRVKFFEVVQEYLGDMQAAEIIGVLEAAKACVIKSAIKELQGVEDE